MLSVCSRVYLAERHQLIVYAVKSFHTLAEAQDFVAGKPSSRGTDQDEPKYYAVGRGLVPGVYLDWPSAQKQIRGVSHPRHKKFNNRTEAEAFVAAFKTHNGGTASAGGLSSEEQIRQLIVKSAPGLQPKGPYIARDKNGDAYGIGTGPLPLGAEDGFDPNIRLDESGRLVHKTDEEKAKQKDIPREKNPPGMLRIYTDGSSLRNGTAGARAGVGVFFGPQDPKYDESFSSSPPSPPALQTQTVYTIDWQARGTPKTKPRSNSHDRIDDEERAHGQGKGPKLTNWRYRNVSEALKGTKQTNQRAELTAIQRALDIAPKHRDVTIYTDSKYAIDCVTNWYRNWERNGWRNSGGKPVENVDLVKGVRAAMAEREQLGRKTLMVWVKGHANTQGNVEADRLAVAGARLGRGLSVDGGGENGDADGNGRCYGDEDEGMLPKTETDTEAGLGTTARGLPATNGFEDSDVQQAFDLMAASMVDGEKTGIDDYP